MIFFCGGWVLGVFWGKALISNYADSYTFKDVIQPQAVEMNTITYPLHAYHAFQLLIHHATTGQNQLKLEN